MNPDLSRFTPQGDNLVVKVLETQTQTSPSGIILPPTAEKPGLCVAEVLLVGPGQPVPILAPESLVGGESWGELHPKFLRQEPTVKPGDLVYFRLSAALPVILDGVALVILPFGHVILVVEKEKIPAPSAMQLFHQMDPNSVRQES